MFVWLLSIYRITLCSYSEFYVVHVHVVEGHVMSITTENEHITVGINICRVAFSGIWLHSWNNSETGMAFSWRASNSWACWISHSDSMLLSLLHAMEIGIEAFISILDDEWVLHRDGSWWGETWVFLLIFWCLLLDSLVFLCIGSGLFHDCLLLLQCSLEWRWRLVLDFSWWSLDLIIGSTLDQSKCIVLKVKLHHFVDFLG